MAVIDTTTEIANLALTKLGAARILSIEDDVKNARAIRAVWNLFRDAEFSAHQWNFTTKRASLAVLESFVPTWGYKYAYQQPDDLICLIEVGDIEPGLSLANYRNLMPSADYRHEGNQIVTNLGPPLVIRYTARVEITGLWDPCFKAAFAAKLAYELCEEITQSNTKRQLAAGDYKAAIRAAITTNAIENPPDPLPDDTWILSRRGGFGG